MTRTRERRPTDFELDILKVLWKHAPTTAREVMMRLGSTRAAGYTTVLKMLQLMESKGMVTVDRAERAHLFSAKLAEEKTMSRLTKDFVAKAFDGATADLLVHLVDGGGLSGSELADLERRIVALRRAEGGRRD